MAQKIIRLPIVDPRSYQLYFFKAMAEGCSRAVMSWPRRAGKDITHFQYLVAAAMKRVGTYYYYFPTLELAKKALWDNIVEFYRRGEVVAAGNMIDILCPEEIRSAKNNSDHFIRLTNGSIIKIGGTDKLDVVGMNGYGYVFSEWQSQKKEAFGYISPILQENGGWALFNGTMRGKRNHLYQDIHRTKTLPGWFSQWLQPEDTLEYYWINESAGISVNTELKGRLHPDTLRPYQNIQSVVDAGEISFALAKQEYLNRAENMVSGGYYDYELGVLVQDGRYCSLDPFNDLIYTFWDLGGTKNKSDATSIVFAQVDMIGKKARVIDYYENRGKLRGHYFDVLKEKGYHYGGHFYPHDGKKTNEWTGETSADTALNEHGTEVRFVPKTQNTQNDIEICRRGFAFTEINKDLCEQLFDRLSCYHENLATEAPCHKNNCPDCNGASHGADAYRTMHMAIHHGLVEPYLQDIRVDNYYVPKNNDEYIIDDGFIV